MKYISQKDIKKSIFVTIDNPRLPEKEAKPSKKETAEVKKSSKKRKTKK
jgi:hypothetical protein